MEKSKWQQQPFQVQSMLTMDLYQKLKQVLQQL
jgi:hypothetical protein